MLLHLVRLHAYTGDVPKAKNEWRTGCSVQQSPNRNEESPLTGCWSLATALRRQTYGRSVFKVVATGRAPGAPAVAWVPRTTYVTASQALTPQEAHGRRSSNGRQGAGQPVRPPGTEHPPRAILAAHEVKHLDHLVSRSSYRVKLLLQLPKRVPAPSFSTGLALSSVDSQRRQGTQGTR